MSVFIQNCSSGLYLRLSLAVALQKDCQLLLRQLQVHAEASALLPASSEYWQHDCVWEGCVDPVELCSAMWVGNLKKLKTVLEKECL